MGIDRYEWEVRITGAVVVVVVVVCTGVMICDRGRVVIFGGLIIFRISLSRLMTVAVELLLKTLWKSS